MALFLQICGVVFLSIIVLALVGVVVIRAKLRRMMRALEELARTVPDGPGARPANETRPDVIDVPFTTIDPPKQGPPSP